VQVVAVLAYGCPFHPGYLRRYLRYRRSPTRVAPPLPAEYPCASLAVYEHGNVLGRFTSQVPPGQFEASSTEPSVRMGPNRMTRSDDGSLALRFELRDPAGELATDLTFRPVLRHPPHVRPFLSRSLSSAEHHWVIAGPMCDVEGVARRTLGAAHKPREISFRGRGYHDHHYGTAPIGPALKRWLRGRAVFKDYVYTFHVARPADTALADEVHLVRCDGDHVYEVVGEEPTVEWSAQSQFFLPYPSEIAFGTRLRLVNPRLVDSSPFHMRLIYHAASHGGREAATALCEVAYPHRLRWPVVGRMIERSIQQAGRDVNGQPPVFESPPAVR
jgi:carotenoid 1,2-hydratase